MLLCADLSETDLAQVRLSDTADYGWVKDDLGEVAGCAFRRPKI